MARYVTEDAFGAVDPVARYRETLPNGVSYDTLDIEPNGFEDNTPVYEVPPGHLFMMGDNRDNSHGQPGSLGGRIRARGESGRPRRGDLLLGRRALGRVGNLEMAVDGALGTAVQAPMKERGGAAAAGALEAAASATSSAIATS